MDFEAGDLRIEDNNYYVQNKKRFIKYAQIMDSDKKECFDFAYDMSYGKIGEHRDSRSGGLIHRKKGQIFINTFQGKMAEFGLYRFLISKNIKKEIRRRIGHSSPTYRSRSFLPCGVGKIVNKTLKSLGFSPAHAIIYAGGGNMTTETHHGRGYVYCLHYHIVWCVKYRHKVLTPEIVDGLVQILEKNSQ